MAWRVGLIEDDAAMRRSLLQGLAADPRWQVVFAVGSVREGWEALDRCPAALPDVVLIDLGLPDGCGLAMLAGIKRRLPDCECLVVSTYGDEERVIRSVEAGASGYILKGQGEQDVAEHLHFLLEGGSPMSPAIARHLLRRISGTARPITTAPGGPVLSPREAEVLTRLARGEPYDEVASALGVSVNTVRFHVKGLYGKLGVNTRQHAVNEARRRGLLLGADGA